MDQRTPDDARPQDTSSGPAAASIARLARAAAWPVAAAVAGLLIVGSYDRYVAPARYAYSSDSASYVEMAESIRAGGWPAVVPWGPELSAQERVAQPLFPPGFPLLAALAAPYAGSARLAEAGLSRAAAALLPFVLLVSFRRLLADPVLTALGLALLGTQGILYWHYVGYTDVPGLCLSVAALGTCWQAARRVGDGTASAWRLALLSGLLAGACYAVRNAGLAVILAAAGLWCLEAWRTPAARRPAFAWAAGLVPAVVALKVYDLVAFGVLAPYSMPASSRGWRLNVADWVSAQLADLQLRAPDAPPLSAAAAGVGLALGAVAATSAYRLVRQRRAPALAARLLLAYAVLGGAMVVASRSRYEWGGDIDVRHALQYTFALVLVAALALDVLVRGRLRRPAALLPWLAAGILGVIGLDTARTEREQPEQLQVLATDRGVIEPVRSLAAGTWLVSNDAVLFRLELGRAARQSDFGGDDQDLRSHLDSLAARVAPRPVAFVLVCDQWTRRLSGCRRSSELPPDPPCRTLRAAEPTVLLCRPGRRLAVGAAG